MIGLYVVAILGGLGCAALVALAERAARAIAPPPPAAPRAVTFRCGCCGAAFPDHFSMTTHLLREHTPRRPLEPRVIREAREIVERRAP